MRPETRLVKLLFTEDNVMLTDIYVTISKADNRFDNYIGDVEYTDGSCLSVYQTPYGNFIGEEWQKW